MRVGIFGETFVGHQLADALAAAHHSITPLRNLADAPLMDMIVLALPPQQLPRAVEALAPHVRSQHVVMHTALGMGAQVLDDVETRGAIVIAASPAIVSTANASTADTRTSAASPWLGSTEGQAGGSGNAEGQAGGSGNAEGQATAAAGVVAKPLAGQKWAMSTLDELGETIGSLLLAECGAVAVEMTDAKRPLLAAKVWLAGMSEVAAAAAREEAVRMLRGDAPLQGHTSLQNHDSVRDHASVQDHARVFPEPTTHDIMYGLAAVSEPAMRRAYVEAARRYAEIVGDVELEMWALQEETR